MSDKPNQIVVLSAVSGAPEPIKSPTGTKGKGNKAEYNPINREIIEKITIWAMTPELYRFPPTQRELALELNISPSWVCKIKKRLPDNMPEFLNMAEDEALSNHRDVVRMITAQAVSGNNKAQKIYMQHLAEPRKQTKENNFHFKSEIVNFGINLVMGKNQPSANEQKTIEGNEIRQLGAIESESENTDNTRELDGITSQQADIPAPQRVAAKP